MEGQHPRSVTGQNSQIESDAISVESSLLDLKYVMVPMAKNQLMIRVQNLNDEYDGVTEGISFDIEAIARSLWYSVNPEGELTDLKVQETSVTGSIEVGAMEERRLKWQTVDKSGPLYSERKMSASNQVLPM